MQKSFVCFCYEFFHIFLPKFMGKYCAKIINVKWANFVLCSCEVSVKAQAKFVQRFTAFQITFP